MAVILLTGAGGAIGGMLRERLGHHELRLTDVRAGDGIARLDVTDAAAVEKACQGADAVVHLGGIASEGPFEDVLAVNVRGTERVLQAAQRTGVYGTGVTVASARQKLPSRGVPTPVAVS